MAVDHELQGAHDKLAKQFQSLESSAKPDVKELESVGSDLSQLKILLTERDLLYPQALDATKYKEELVLARHVLEIGALWSVRKKDTNQFERYWSQLKPFYLDLDHVLPPSDLYEPIVGLSLLRDLSSNAIASFHIALEALPVSLVQNSKYIQHPVLLERWLMEGSYSNVWHERQNVPREEYRFFVDMLMITIRHEIASCEEKAYDTLPLNDVATLLFFDSQKEVMEFASERGWHINPTSQTVEFANKKTDRDSEAQELIPMRSTITTNLHFAKELESIV
ncbi:regulatory particle non-ATPase [Malassezia pachydermatis]|uniref:26s proteasome non-atpase regulatory subunit 8 n=1 Tax=Malassezia pachydermatis TaxID=77020 RepID=A0A0M8MS46_9BASI|nr:26s proteasome non-atpase regulatory subunit 8 [Malassezia pachydermatis]KOS12680.1 26s proteasome non-atpase regulatory subunit 8 [Malassezia pachydermatis]